MKKILVLTPNPMAFRSFMRLMGKDITDEGYKYIDEAEKLHGYRQNTVIIYERLNKKMSEHPDINFYLYGRDFNILRAYEDDYRRRAVLYESDSR